MVAAHFLTASGMLIPLEAVDEPEGMQRETRSGFPLPRKGTDREAALFTQCTACAERKL